MAAGEEDGPEVLLSDGDKMLADMPEDDALRYFIALMKTHFIHRKI